MQTLDSAFNEIVTKRLRFSKEEARYKAQKRTHLMDREKPSSSCRSCPPRDRERESDMFLTTGLRRPSRRGEIAADGSREDQRNSRDHGCATMSDSQ